MRRMIWTVTRVYTVTAHSTPLYRTYPYDVVEFTREDGEIDTQLRTNYLDATVGDQYTYQGYWFVPFVSKLLIEVEL